MRGTAEPLGGFSILCRTTRRQASWAPDVPAAVGRDLRERPSWREVPPPRASAQQYPVTSGDPRIGLAAGAEDATAGKVSLGMQHLSNTPHAARGQRHNSDAAFQGNYAVQRQLQRRQHLRRLEPGGAGARDVDPLPRQPERRVGLQQPAVRVRGVRRAPRRTARSTPDAVDPRDALPRHPHLRHLATSRNPAQLSDVQTCRGSHTHTLVTPEERPEQRLHLRLGHVGRPPDHGDRRPARSNAPGHRPELVVLADRGHQGPARQPERRVRRERVAPVHRPEPPAASTACRTRRDPEPPVRVRVPAASARALEHRRRDWAPTPITDACHDITVYEEIDLAAGACEGNGLLIDISDPANPKRIDAVADPLFAYWHGATFSNDGKADPVHGRVGRRQLRSLPRDRPAELGRRRDLRDRQQEARFRSYYKLPVAQTTARELRLARGQPRPDPRQEHHDPGLVPGWRLADRLDRPVGPEGDRLLRPRPGRRDGSSSSGGFWSTYWYNGTIYGTEIARGLDTFKLDGDPAPDGRRDRAPRRSPPSSARSTRRARTTSTTWTSAPVTGSRHRHRAGDALAHPRHAGGVRRVHAGRRQDVRGRRPPPT